MKKIKSFVLFLAIVVVFISLPKGGIRKMQGKLLQTLSVLAPLSTSEKEELSQVKLQNQLFTQQLERLKQWILEKELLHTETLALDQTLLENRKQYLSHILKLQLYAIPAQVVLKEPLNKNFVWLNVGEKDNRLLKEPLIAKNSPVVIGKTIVGVVETVLEKHCSVRLITDPNLAISVRALRGKEQNHALAQQIDSLTSTLNLRKDLPHALALCEMLGYFKKQIQLEEKDLYFAKGELRGALPSLTRAFSPTLQGVGFNYDFADKEGSSFLLTEKPLIQTGDLLVTTGFDGVFPEGFHLATVSRVLPLLEGATSYKIEAKALANLQNCVEVFILPSTFIEKEKAAK